MQAACEQVDRSGFEGRISTVIAEMPIKALGNQPLVSISDAPEDSAPAGVSPSGTVIIIHSCAHRIHGFDT